MGEFREIEKKFFLHDETYHSARGKVDAFLEQQGGVFKETVGSGGDTFWRVAYDTFLRIREYDGEKDAGQMSMKITDQGDILDRLETNITLKTEADIDNAIEMCNVLYGESVREVWKKYHIFWITNDANIVIYETDKDLPLILEVEGPSDIVVMALELLCRDIFNLEPVDKSLFELVGAIDG